MSARYDVVVFGATGFTGQRVATRIAERAPSSLRWAVAGRRADKLEEVARRTGAHGTIVADVSSPETVDAMVEQARVIATTVGPYTKYGTPVVDACVRKRVDYVDITGETPWVRDLIDRYHDQAARDGTRIVPFCGFDSIPSDLGTLIAVDELRQRTGGGVARAMGAFRLRGGLNGGTWDTAMTLASSPDGRRAANTLLLNPDGYRDKSRHVRDLKRVVRDDLFPDRWLAPFFMASVNTRVVRRSAALSEITGDGYGADFRYQEAMEFRSRLKATGMLLALGGLLIATQTAPTRKLLEVLGPDPGQGPSEEAIEGGFFRIRVAAEAESGERLAVTMQRDGDPGNRVTAALLCEAALHLAMHPRDELPGGVARGGILTPATALGLSLVPRLREAEFQIDVESV